MGGVLSNIGSESPTIRMIDSERLYMGTDNDFSIYHDGSNAQFVNTTGQVFFLSDTALKFKDAGGNETFAAFNDNGGVDLYYDNSKKLETTTNGIDVTGEVLADKAYIAESTLTDGATVTWDMSTQSVCKLTLGGNRTISAPTNGSTGQFASILVIQDGTGSRSLTWNAAYEFASDTAPTLTTTASLGDLFTFRYNGTKWLEVGRNQALTLS